MSLPMFLLRVASQMFGAKFRTRSPKNVVDELEWLRDEY